MGRSLIAFTGRAGVGKDEAARILFDYGYQRRAFADTLRWVAYAADPFVQVGALRGEFERLSSLVDAVGWDRAKQFGDVRRFLQRLGTEGVRNHLGDDTWLRALDLSPERTVVTDCRFENEAAFIRSNGGTVVRVERAAAMPVVGHVSEAQRFEADVTIRNDGTLDDLRLALLPLLPVKRPLSSG